MVSDRAERILLSPPHMSGRELDAVRDAFESNWIAPLGPHVDAFEQEFAAVVGAGQAAALSSGTAALHLALRLLDVGPGDEVLVSDLTFAASVNPIIYCSAAPVFIDSERQSWNMDPDLLESGLATRARAGRLPKAVVVVHLYGQCADMDPIMQACDRFGVAVVEDAAEALGASHGRSAPGTFGRLGAFSFNGNKVITTSGGGMLVSNDASLIERARYLASQARNPAAHYEHSEIGYNYRLSNILAAIGSAQLQVLDERVAARRRTFADYERHLADLPGVEFMPEAPWGIHARWLTTLTIDPSEFGADREQVRLALESANIESRPVWKPMHLQAVFRGCERLGGAVSEDLFERGLCLPSGSSLERRDLDRVVSVIRECAG
jgi:dTDP-4-amino-4,6-dideoxygalactose transaminase